MIKEKQPPIGDDEFHSHDLERLVRNMAKESGGQHEPDSFQLQSKESFHRRVHESLAELRDRFPLPDGAPAASSVVIPTKPSWNSRRRVCAGAVAIVFLALLLHRASDESGDAPLIEARLDSVDRLLDAANYRDAKRLLDDVGRDRARRFGLGQRWDQLSRDQFALDCLANGHRESLIGEGANANDSPRTRVAMAVAMCELELVPVLGPSGYPGAAPNQSVEIKGPVFPPAGSGGRAIDESVTALAETLNTLEAEGELNGFFLRFHLATQRLHYGKHAAALEVLDAMQPPDRWRVAYHGARAVALFHLGSFGTAKNELEAARSANRGRPLPQQLQELSTAIDVEQSQLIRRRAANSSSGP